MKKMDSERLVSKQPQMDEPQPSENLSYGEGAKRRVILEQRRREQYGPSEELEKWLLR